MCTYSLGTNISTYACENGNQFEGSLEGWVSHSGGIDCRGGQGLSNVGCTSTGKFSKMFTSVDVRCLKNTQDVCADVFVYQLKGLMPARKKCNISRYRESCGRNIHGLLHSYTSFAMAEYHDKDFCVFDKDFASLMNSVLILRGYYQINTTDKRCLSAKPRTSFPASSFWQRYWSSFTEIGLPLVLYVKVLWVHDWLRACMYTLGNGYCTSLLRYFCLHTATQETNAHTRT